MLSLTDFDYHLPDTKIAQVPVDPRDSSKLLVVNRAHHSLQDHIFRDLADLLTSNDVLVVNDTKVIPARLIVEKPNGKHMEILLEKEVEVTADSISWEVLTKPGIKEGQVVLVPGTSVTLTCTKVLGYTRIVRFNIHREAFFELLYAQAHTPIPPYIHWDDSDELELRKRYQTVYARYEGAVAAPTAGLHFTPQLLENLQRKGVQIEYLTLHVGLGTFLPVKDDNVTQHHMHEERFHLSQETATALNSAKQAGKRIIAVGTTTVRVLEACATHSPTGARLTSQHASTAIFIYPPYQFAFVDSLITNFHTPKSTLLMLVSALTCSPNTEDAFETFATTLVGKAYQHALENEYRFYSFGDAMWIQ